MIGSKNPKLEWAENTQDTCNIHSGTGHACGLVKNHKRKKHSCDCGREWYGRSENY